MSDSFPASLVRSGPPLARWSVVLLVLVACVGCDQWTKQAAITRLKGQPPRSFCRDLVRLQYAENPGAFLGLGGQLPASARWALLVAFNAVLTAGIAVFLLAHPAPARWTVAACVLLLAGGVGNLIDRVRFDGLVVDFLNLGVGPLRTGIFNVADMAITSGAVLLGLASLSAPRPPVPQPPTVA